MVNAPSTERSHISVSAGIRTSRTLPPTRPSPNCPPHPPSPRTNHGNPSPVHGTGNSRRNKAAGECTGGGEGWNTRKVARAIPLARSVLGVIHGANHGREVKIGTKKRGPRQVHSARSKRGRTRRSKRTGPGSDGKIYPWTSRQGILREQGRRTRGFCVTLRRLSSQPQQMPLRAAPGPNPWRIGLAIAPTAENIFFKKQCPGSAVSEAPPSEARRP